MIERLVTEILEKHKQLTEELADPGIFNNPSRYAEVSTAHAHLSDAQKLAQQFQEAKEAAKDAESMLEEGGVEPDMKEYLSEELEAARTQIDSLDEKIRMPCWIRMKEMRRTPSWKSEPGPGVTKHLSLPARSIACCSGMRRETR